MRHELADNFEKRERPDRTRPLRPGSAIGRQLWRVTGRWYVTVIVLVLLWANARYLSTDSTGNWPAMAPTGTVGQPMVPYAVGVRRNGEVLCIDLGAEKESDEMLGLVAYSYRSRSSAAATLAFEFEEVINNSVGGPQVDPALVRAAYLAWLAKHPDAYWKRTAARMSGTAAVTGWRTLRLYAIARTVAVIVLIVLLIRSLEWTLPFFDAAGRSLSRATLTPAERAALKRKKALQRGECPACGYDIRRLPARVCPECSHRWTQTEAGLVP